ncbi:MAG: HEAT repeat domain-containing protein [Synechococcus sp.]
MKKLLEEARAKGGKQDLAQQDLQDSTMRQSAFGVPPSLEVQSPFDPSPNAIASPPWKPYLEQLWEGDFQSRWEVSKQLAAFSDDVLPDLFALLEESNTDGELLWFVARILGKFDRPEVAATLVQLLAGESEEVAAAAAIALANFGTAAIQPLQALMADPERRLMAINALAYIRSNETIPVLIEATGDRDPAVRAAAIEALCSLPSNPDVLDLLIGSLDDPSSQVRQVTLKGLAVRMRAHPKRDWSLILSPLLADVNLSVAQAATEAMGRLATPLAVQELDRLLQDRLTPPSLRILAVRALTWIERPDAIESLQQVLRCAPLYEAEIVLECIRGLGRYEPPPLILSASQALQEWFVSLDVSRQPGVFLQAIAHSLGRLGQPDSIPSLISLLEVKDSGVRFHAIAALKQFNRAIVTHLLQQNATTMLPSNPHRQGIDLALSEL